MSIAMLAFGMALINLAGCKAPPVHKVDLHGPETFRPPGYRQYVSIWMWTAPASDVEVWVSDTGEEWTSLGQQRAEPGTNQFSLLIPTWYCDLEDANPIMRIVTLDRRYGFETQLKLRSEK